MKKQKFLLGAAGLLALGLTACSDKEDLGFKSQKVDKDQTRYITVTLSTPTNYMTRAGEFDNGGASESAVNRLLFVFYDGTGAPTAEYWSPTATQLASGWQDNGTGNNVTRFWTSTVPVNMTQGQDVPVYVMCYINPIDQAGLTEMTLSEIDIATRSAVKNGNYFAMSNSVYYGNNPITGQQNVRMMATPITSDKLYSTEEEAKAADAKTLDIYVERYAAKIGLNMSPTAIKPYDVLIPGENGEMTEAQISFTPAFWRPNAVDLTTYITKNYATGNEDVTIPASYAELNTAFENSGLCGSLESKDGQGLDGWNDALNFRSYWACSPSYYANKYPQVSDNITDVYTGAEGQKYPYDIRYFSMADLRNSVEGTPIAWNTTNGFSTTNESDNVSGYFYCRETTASIDYLTKEGINNKAIPASAAIIGNYKLTKIGETNVDNANETFYLYGKSSGKDVYYTDANIEQALISNQNVIFTDNQGENRAESTTYFSVKHPSKAVRGDENVAGRLVTIQIDETNVPTGLYFYYNGAFTEINGTNVVAANQLLWKSASTAQKFHQGLAFFAIPIRHLGWNRNVDPQKPLLSDPTSGRPSAINWANLRRGDLGVVRNHVYNIEVTSVEGLGIGLENANQPMVPPMDPDNYYIAARVNILAWRVVPTTSVVL